MSPFEELLIRAIDQTRRDRACVSVPTRYLSIRLSLMGLNIPDRSLRHHLNNLEKSGYVNRPIGPKSGWAVV